MNDTEQTDMISKKELLLNTGISYGQLYRWKRERLIPDSWFVKKSSFTGQETFFPKEKIQTRIKAILDMKDSHSLGEMATLFSPVLSTQSFSIDTLMRIPRMNVEVLIRVAAFCKSQHLSFKNVLLCYVFSRVIDDHSLSNDDKETLYQSIPLWEKRLENAHQALLLKKGGFFSVMLTREGVEIWPDAATSMTSYSLSELSRELRNHLPDTAE